MAAVFARARWPIHRPCRYIVPFRLSNRDSRCWRSSASAHFFSQLCLGGPGSATFEPARMFGTDRVKGALAVSATGLAAASLIVVWMLGGFGLPSAALPSHAIGGPFPLTRG